MPRDRQPTNFPLFSTLVQMAYAGAWTAWLVKNRKLDALLAGLMIALFDFPLQWLNEVKGPYWRINREDTAKRLRVGFPFEEPALFYFGGSLLCLLTENRSSSVFRKWGPAVLIGLAGGTMDTFLNRRNKLQLDSTPGHLSVFLLYGLGSLSILSFRDRTKTEQFLLLLGLLVLTGVTFPDQPAAAGAEE